MEKRGSRVVSPRPAAFLCWRNVFALLININCWDWYVLSAVNDAVDVDVGTSSLLGEVAE